MLSRRVLFPLALAGAVGGPATYYSAGNVKSVVGSLGGGAAEDAVLQNVDDYTKAAQQPGQPGPLKPLDVVPLPEALRFDVTPQWVMGRWPRVSTQLADLDLQGYRVTLVTGTTPGDLAGSLTYYFSHDGKLQRITFRGSTGDPGPLAQWVTEHFNLRRTVGATPGEMLFQEAWGGKAGSELKFTPVEIIRNELPQARFAVELTLARPRSMW